VGDGGLHARPRPPPPPLGARRLDRRCRLVEPTTPREEIAIS